MLGENKTSVSRVRQAGPLGDMMTSDELISSNIGVLDYSRKCSSRLLKEILLGSWTLTISLKTTHCFECRPVYSSDENGSAFKD